MIFRAMFSWCKWLLLVAWLLIILFVGARLAQLNQQEVVLNAIIWQSQPTPLGLVLCLCLMAGVVIGLASVVPSYLFLKMRLARARARQPETPKAPATRPAPALLERG